MRPESILVTGGAGFIGSHLVERLAREGRKVLILDNLSSGKQDNITRQMGKNSINFTQGDARDKQLVNELCTDAVAIIHLAALVDHETCLHNPNLAHEVNATGTLTVLEAARRHDVKNFVYASSAALYGENAKLPISEDASPAPISIYGASKFDGEQYCLKYLRDYGLGIKCLRFFNVFGPRQYARQYSGVIIEFMKRLQQNEPPVIFGDGFQTRDFTNIKDVVEGTMLALESDQAAGLYNIATGRETTVTSLAQTVINISGKTLTAIHVPPREGEIRHSVADINRAKTQLHFIPKTNLEHDLRQLWNWQESTLDKRAGLPE